MGSEPKGAQLAKKG